MSLTKSNSIATKIAIGAIGVAFVFGLLFAAAVPAQAALTTDQTNMIIGLLESFGVDAATIANVRVSLTGGTPSVPSGGSTASVCPHTWSTSLTSGSSGADVKALQQFLNSDSATQIASSGVGSAGSETDFFGGLTKAAVIKFQDKYASEVLTPVGLSAGTGYFGSSSRAKANALCSTASTTTDDTTTDDTTTTTPVATGTGLSVVAGAQPAATLAPDSAARVPFTNFIVTAGSDGDVVMDNVTIERTGLSADAVFASVVLLDGDGAQIGLTKTLNSNHQAKVGEKVTIKSGTSQSFTIAGNMAADNSDRDGGTPRLDVVAINTSATVTGSLPIVGTTQTVNASLAIGTVTVQRGSLDPNAAATKEVGTTGYTFSSLKVTAGSTEKVRLHSVRWNQASSVAASDLENLVTIVDDVEYPLVISADGKFYTAKFPGGILLDKGLSKEISVKGDIVGGSGRTIAFAVEKKTDINLSGETFGYGITPPTSGTGITAGNIWFPGSTVTVSGGSITVNQDTSVISDTIAVNLAGQTLAAFKVKIQGEPVSVGQIVFDVATTTGAWTGLLTDVTLVDSNGAVAAGPVDQTETAAGAASITFTDSVTFPIGEGTYTVKGKVASTAASDGTYRFTTNPASDWTSVTGDTTGNTITPGPSGDQALQTMTVKAAAVTLSTSNTPAAQNVVAGAQDYTFTNIQFDTTSSGEDVKFTTFLMNYSTDGDATDATSCQLFNGATALNTGSNVVNPSAAASSTTFTFDAPLILSKGVVTTLALKCDLSSAATANEGHYWSYAPASSPSATGLVSGQSATITEPTAANSLGQKQTVVDKGTIAVTLDPSSPGYRPVVGGTTDNTVSALKFTGTNEPITLQRVALVLTNNSSSSASDLVQVRLFDGSAPVGTAIFTSGNTVATSTITGVTVPKNGSVTLTVKADIASIGTGQPVTVGGHFIAVDWDTSASIGTRGVGQESGSTIDRTDDSDTASAGVRSFRSVPTIEKIALSTSESTLSNGSGRTLMKWKVSADSAGDIGVSKFTFTFATTTATLDTLDVFAYSDSGFNNPVTGLYSGSGDFSPTDKDLEDPWADATTQFDFTAHNSSSASTTVQVPAGGSIYFILKGTVTGSASGAAITATMQGDAAYPTAGFTNNLLYTTNALNIDDLDTHDDFLWSSNATQTPAAITDGDWSNGYGVITTDSIEETLSP
ncbi:MAG: hypothetical protein QGH83_00295 [Candidatus Pacebacteria bacterium]|nr:hypothetical protein [Candidatus Paceibacterota bacterium]